MKLAGIISDTHGHTRSLKVAIELFDSLGVETVVHCGDVGGMAVFDEFVGRDFRFVWGNTDMPGPGIYTYLDSTGIVAPATVPLRFELCGKTIEVYHGHEPEFRQAMAAPRSDYILHGHTHLRRDERIGSTRVVNSGALHRAHVHSVATLDLENDVVEFYEIKTA